jgi:N-acetylmuramoyl-L-alanine amidase/FG-GAP-like repeat
LTRNSRSSRHRRRTSLIAYGAGALALATAAAYGTIALASPSDDASDEKARGPYALQEDFASAAEEFKVPQNVLMAVAYRQTLWDSHGGQPSTTGSYNVMALTQVDPGDVADDRAAAATDELNLSGDPAKARHFHPDARALAQAGKVDTGDPRLHTLDEAAELIGKPAAELRTDRLQSVRGAAALLAQYEKDAYGSLPEDTGRWYPAVARYSQSPDTKGADLFAGRVFDSIRTGESRTTDDGQQVTLPAAPSVRAVKLARTPLAATWADTAATPTPECPTSLNCNFVPAAFQQNGTTDKGDYGNYDVTDRPADGVKINSIVVHDTEGSYSGALSTFQNPTAYASAHYLIRASDGLVTQLVQTKNTAWHAGNKSVNMHSVGIEHEGYAIRSGSWYTEPQYESSAQLVRYLTALYGIPRDREHIVGHDEVPGPLDAYVAGMHWDPGPYWDWNHYIQLIGGANGAGNAGAPLRTGQVIRVVPPYTTANQPAVTYNGTAQAAHPANFGYLYTQPSTTSARLGDPYLHSGTAGTTEGPDWGDKVVAGGSYVVAQQYGNWTAIWYGGQKGWFYNPGGQFSATVGTTSVNVLTPAAGLGSVPVYGRAYPESAAYTGTDVPVQTDNDKALTEYTVPAGQKYVPAGPAVSGSYFYAENFDNSAPGDHTLVTGTTQFYPIRYNHRLAWVRTTDVTQVASTAPLPGSTRNDLMGRDSSGVIWQYQGTGNATTPFLSRFKVGTWLNYDAITALTPLRADGVGDLVARDTSGVLWYYQGSGSITHPFRTRVKVGTGFSGYTALTGARDVNGDGRADLLARDSHGNLWLYKGNGTATVFASRVAVSSGWNGYTALAGVGDVTADGKADLVARDSSGNLWLYKGNGTSALFAARVAVGTGWNVHNALVGVGDITGDGKADLIARDTRGVLWEYKGTGSATGPWAARVQVGTGFGIYSQLF